MNIQKIITYLEIKNPVEIQIRSKKKKNMEAGYWGLYAEDGELKSHLIRIYGFDTSRKLETLIAHELIHAWQEENGICEIHGPEFRKMAQEMQEEFGICDIYIPELDLE